MEGLVSEVEQSPLPVANADKSFRQMFALICAILGCAGWLLTLFLMGGYEDGEKLARFFQALVNVLILATFGGIGTILSVIALLLTTASHGGPQTSVRQIGFYLSRLGLVMGSLILISQLPGALSHLN